MHKVHRFLVTDEWKELLSQGQEYFEENNLSRWISDNRELPTIHSNIDKWLTEEWIPKMVALGWKKWAVIEPEISEGKRNHKKYKQFFEEVGVEIQSFTELDSARQWIRD